MSISFLFLQKRSDVFSGIFGNRYIVFHCVSTCHFFGTRSQHRISSPYRRRRAKFQKRYLKRRPRPRRNKRCQDFWCFYRNDQPQWKGFAASQHSNRRNGVTWVTWVVARAKPNLKLRPTMGLLEGQFQVTKI